MRLDNQCVVWVNCETKEEQEKILDIFECIGAKWYGNKSPRQTTYYRAPMHFLLEKGLIRHGSIIVDGTEDWVKNIGGVIVSANDFHNQWISLRRRK